MPTLDDDLIEGHSKECMNLGVKYYTDLNDKIKVTVGRVRDSLYAFMEIDIDFASEVDRAVGFQTYNCQTYESFLKLAVLIQKEVSKSQLSDEEKQRFWQPIVQCYAEVQDALQERIIPPEERELVEVGDTFTVPVRVHLGSSGMVSMSARVPDFTFAIKRWGGAGEYRDALNSVMFLDSYLLHLPKDVKEKLNSGVHNLPLKIVSAEYGMLIIVEIDEEALMAMGDKDE